MEINRIIKQVLKQKKYGKFRQRKNRTDNKGKETSQFF
jgi:hypothetical protein